MPNTAKPKRRTRPRTQRSQLLARPKHPNQLSAEGGSPSDPSIGDDITDQLRSIRDTLQAATNSNAPASLSSTAPAPESPPPAAPSPPVAPVASPSADTTAPAAPPPASPASTPTPTPAPVIPAASAQPPAPAASVPPPAPLPASEQTITLSTADVQVLYEQAAQAEQFEQQLTASRQETEQLRTQLNSSETENTTLTSGHQDLLNQINQLLHVSGAQPQPTSAQGRPNGVSQAYSGMNFNAHLSQSDKVTGLMVNCLSAFEGAPPMAKATKNGGTIITRDTSALSVLVRDHWNALAPDLEVYAKRNGMLRGGRSVDTLAPTQGSDLPVGFLPILSAKMRWSQLPQYIYWTLPTVRLNFEKGIGDTIQIPRSPYEPEPVSANDYLLSGRGAYTQLTADRGNIRVGDVPLVLDEWGRGKPGTNVFPLAITTFLQAYSLIDALNILMRNLRVNHMAWADKRMRELISQTSVAYYNNGGAATQAIADLNPDSDGRLSRRFLRQLYARMRSLQVPTLPGGLYRLFTNTIDAANLVESLEENWQSPTSAELLEVANMLNLGRQDAMQIQRVDGVVGIIGNFLVQETNAHSLGAPGTEGVNALAIGDGSTHTFRSSYAMGAEVVAKAVGMDFEVRGDEFQDFGRIKSFSWFEHSQVAPLDLDPVAFGDTSDVPQQLRCFEIRCTQEKL